MCRKYMFQVSSLPRTICSLLIICALSGIFMTALSSIETQITTMVLSRIQTFLLVEDVMIISFFGLMLLAWIVTFNLTNIDCTVIMHDKHMDITLGKVNHLVEYKQIRSFFLPPKGYSAEIELLDGTKIIIQFSIRFRIRDVIAGVKFVNALESEIKKLRK